MSVVLRCPSDHAWTEPGPCPVCGRDAVPAAHPAGLAAGDVLTAPWEPTTPTGSGEPRPPIPPGPPGPPPTIPGYEIRDEVGAGGMGVVYRAVQLSLRRDVALKLIRSGEFADAQDQRRFLVEAEVVAGLRHRNIVQVFDYGVAQGRPYYTMELIDGASLTKKLLAGPLPDREIARLVATLARAVQHAHDHGIVHRDLKPDNILLAADGTPKLVDFGVAKRLEVADGPTEAGKLVGTPSYMAPEQAAGKKEIGPGADVYALGVILYKLLSGRVPFSGDSLYDVLHRIVTEEPVSPAWYQTDTPRDLEAICLKCLRKNPAERYATAADLAADLDRYLNHERISVGWTPPWRRAAKWCRRRPAAATSVVAVAVAAVAAVVVAGVIDERHKTQERDRIAEQQRYDAGLAAERRQRAMNDAITAAMGGDVDRADAAIRDAQRNGATDGDVAMLRGLLLYQQGNAPAAVEHLKRAAELEPNSVAVRSLLGICYAENVDWAMTEKTVEEVQPLPPVTPHDFLFKGYLLAIREKPADGIPLLETAVEKRLLLATAFLARTRAIEAFDMNDRVGLERALRDMTTARAVFRDTAFVHLADLEVSMIAGFMYEEMGDRAKTQEAWQQAGLAFTGAAGLSRSNTLRCVFAEHQWGEAAAAKVAREDWARFGPKASMWPTIGALWLYRDGQVSDALNRMEERRRGADDLSAERLRAYLLVERDGNPTAAIELYKQLEAANQSSPIALFFLQDILLFAGKADLVAENARRFRTVAPWSNLRWSEFQKRTLAYLAGPADAAAEKAYLDATAKRNARCNALWWVGLRRLAVRDLAGARKNFEAARATNAFVRYGYRTGGAFLARMNDPAWPRWITPATKP